MLQLTRCGGCRFEFTSAGVVEAQTLGGDIGHGIGELWPEAVHLCLQCLVKCKTLYATQPSPSIAPSNQPDSLPGGASSGAAPPVTNSEGIKSLRFACEKEASAWARTQAGRFKSMPGRRRLYECAHKGCESRRLVIHDPKGGASEPWRISPSGECDHGDGDTDDTWAFLGPEARDRLVGHLKGYNKPLQALSLLRAEFEDHPTEGPRVLDERITKEWVANFRNRHVKDHTPKLSVVELERWVEQHPAGPGGNPNASFVLGSDTTPDGQNFWIGLTTVALLQNAARGKGPLFVMLDGTFRVIKEGYTMIMLGTVDDGHHFLPIAVCVATAARKRVVTEPFLQHTKKWVQLLVPEAKEWSPLYSMSDHSATLRGGIQSDMA